VQHEDDLDIDVTKMTPEERADCAAALAREVMRRYDVRGDAMKRACELERAAHRLLDEAWMLVSGNPSDAHREEAQGRVLEATGLHRKAIDILDPLWA
jgi:hypothetical protein